MTCVAGRTQGGSKLQHSEGASGARRNLNQMLKSCPPCSYNVAVSKEDDLFRLLPAVGQLLQESEFEHLSRRFGRARVKAGAQSAVDDLRKRLDESEITDSGELSEMISNLGARLERSLEASLAPSLFRLINATGVLIHTNLGRAPLSSHVARAILDLATGYSNLEYRVEEGRRGHRDQHFEHRLRSLLPCEAATVCNNNAAAVFLILNTLAEGKEVLVSRGELVEIGGSFRIPAILEKSGAKLREVGTTNKTRISDYQEAISEQTGLILKVHPSNYRIIGFTAQVQSQELVKLANRTSVPLVEDAGSGNLFPSRHVALSRERAIETSLIEGFDLVCFSGDKLLGGPQAGIIAGRQSLIDKIRKNPLMRVLRVDKLTYAALEGTMIEIEKGESGQATPIWRMLTTPLSELQPRVQHLSSQLEASGWTNQIVSTRALLGGGSAPEESIPSLGVRIDTSSLTPNALERCLRTDHGVISRIENDHVILDLRTVLPEQDDRILSAFRRILSQVVDSATAKPEHFSPTRE